MGPGVSPPLWPSYQPDDYSPLYITFFKFIVSARVPRPPNKEVGAFWRELGKQGEQTEEQGVPIKEREHVSVVLQQRSVQVQELLHNHSPGERHGRGSSGSCELHHSELHEQQ